MATIPFRRGDRVRSLQFKTTGHGTVVSVRREKGKPPIFRVRWDNCDTRDVYPDLACNLAPANS